MQSNTKISIRLLSRRIRHANPRHDRCPRYSSGFYLDRRATGNVSHTMALLDKARGPQAVIADKGYDSEALIEHIMAMGAELIIPPRRNLKVLRTYDIHRYKARNLVE